nr:Maf family protein [Rhizobium halophytocola]
MILASSSPFRRGLMEQAGLAFDWEDAGVDERAIESDLDADMDPATLALHLARAKAMAVSRRNPQALVLGCDQTMALGMTVFHKAASLDEARANLSVLRGKTHRLNSAMSLVADGVECWGHVEPAEMSVRDFSDGFLDGYIARAGKGVLKSVGSYQLDGLGVQLFERVTGDYFTVIGLPLIQLLAKLREMGEIDG